MIVFGSFVVLVVSVVVVFMAIKLSYDAAVRHKGVLKRSQYDAEYFFAKTDQNVSLKKVHAGFLQDALFSRLCENPHVKKGSAIRDFIFGKKVDYQLENAFLDAFEKMINSQVHFNYESYYVPIEVLVPNLSTSDLIILMKIENDVDDFSLEELFNASVVNEGRYVRQLGTFVKQMQAWIEAAKENISFETTDNGTEYIVLHDRFKNLPFEWQFSLAEGRKEAGE